MIVAMLAAVLTATTPPLNTPIGQATAACVGDAVNLGMPTESDIYNTQSTTVGVFDQGHSLVMIGDSSFGIYDCIRKDLDLPEWTNFVMDRTTSQAGLVTVELGEYTVMWSYHPDNGALVVLYDSEASGSA